MKYFKSVILALGISFYLPPCIFAAGDDSKSLEARSTKDNGGERCDLCNKVETYSLSNKIRLNGFSLKVFRLALTLPFVPRLAGHFLKLNNIKRRVDMYQVGDCIEEINSHDVEQELSGSVVYRDDYLQGFFKNWTRGDKSKRPEGLGEYRDYKEKHGYAELINKQKKLMLDFKYSLEKSLDESNVFEHIIL